MQRVIGTQDSNHEHDGIDEDIDLLPPLDVTNDIDHCDWHGIDLPDRDPGRQESHVRENTHEDEHSSHFSCFSQEFLEKPAVNAKRRT